MDTMKQLVEKEPEILKTPDFPIDGIHSHQEHVKRRLSFLKFILTDGRRFLQKSDAEKANVFRIIFSNDSN